MNERDSQSQPQSLHYLLLVGLLAGLVLGMFWFQGVRAAGEGTLIQIARNMGTSNVFSAEISAGGDRVSFASDNDSLTADADTNGMDDVFLYEVDTATYTLVSRAFGGGAGNDWSGYPSISADGSRIVFRSDATDLTTDVDTNGSGDIFLYDVVTETITLVSQAVDGGAGNDWSGYPSISADGSKVVFVSGATDLTADADTNGITDIFLYDVATGTITLVSQAVGGGAANGWSYSPEISADGSKVVFYSSANDLTDVDTNGSGDIFLYDVATGTLTLVSQATTGGAANGSSYSPEVSADGSKVVFSSRATDLTTDVDTNGAGDIFLYDVATEAITLVSQAATGGAGNGEAGYYPQISADGSKVVFSSYATDLTTDADTNGDEDIFLYDAATGTITLVSRATTGGAGNNGSYYSGISTDGSRVILSSYATDLTADVDTNGESDAFLYDVATGTITLLSQAIGGGAGNDISVTWQISADGSAVLIESAATDLTTDPITGIWALFLYSTNLAAPTGLTATANGQTQIDLSWTDNSDNEDGFKIERSDDGATGWTQIAMVGADVTTYSDTGLTCETTRYYRVRAYNTDGDSGYSNVDGATTAACPLDPPTAPTGLSATANGQTQIDLSWTDNSDNEDGFKIERSDDGATGWTQIAMVGANVTAYSDTGLTCETTRYYRVRAYNTDGDSGYSNVDDATTATCPLDPPAAPTSLGATANGQTQIDLSWTDNSDNEDGFKIERSDDGATGWTQIGMVGADVTTYSDTGLTCETTRYYRVRAYNTDGDSGYSNVDGATTAACPSDLDADTTGIFRPTNGWIYLKNANTSGFADQFQIYGVAGDLPVAGDWDGDGIDSIGVYRNGTFYLRNDPGACEVNCFADIVAPFGSPGDLPTAGDWNGDGVDTVGVYRNGTFFLTDTNATTDMIIFGLGVPGDLPIAGDWDGDNDDSVGVFRPSNGWIYLKFENTTGFADQFQIYGIANDLPLAGDWDGDGVDSIGVLRGNWFYLRNDPSACEVNCFADTLFQLGNPGDLPIAGNWDGLP